MAIVISQATAITIMATVCAGPGRGSRYRMTATACVTVLILPPRPAAITPYRSTTKRSRVIPHSRTKIVIVTHHDSSSMIDRPMNAMPVSALSAIGSASLPKRVMMLCLRAKCPSKVSVRIATLKITAVRNRHQGCCGWASSIQAKIGTNRMRNVVSALGRFHGLVSGSAIGPTGWVSLGASASGSGFGRNRSGPGASARCASSIMVT